MNMMEQTDADQPSAQASNQILSTGIEGLDVLLGGGIPAGSLLLVVGAPGTGKTLLTQQLCFNLAARGEGKALYFSTLSEPHGKLVRQIESLGFYQRQLLGESVTLLALQDFLEQGLEATADVIVRTARLQRARLVCIDGFRAIEAAGGGELATRQFLYQLSSQLHLLGATAVVTLERAAFEHDEYGALTIADGAIICHFDVVGVRHRRKVEIRKLRTMAHLHGLHTYRIGKNGWTVFPRLEELVPAETTDVSDGGWSERMGFGIDTLDGLLDGGFASESTSMIVGEPGLGKTLLGLNWVHAGLERGEPALFIGFDEQRDLLLERARRFGIPLSEHIDAGRLSIRTFAPVENEPDEIADVICEMVESLGVRRLLLDGVFYLERATAREDRAHDFFGALTTYLRKAGVTLCATKTINRLGADQLDFRDTPLSLMADNLIWLRHLRDDSRLRRALSVMALRDGNPDQGVYEYEIGPTGVVIKGHFGHNES
jgi:circadian clock protein KaiC